METGELCDLKILSMAYKMKLTQSYSLIGSQSQSLRTGPLPSLSVRFGPYIVDLNLSLSLASRCLLVNISQDRTLLLFTDHSLLNIQNK